MTVDAFIDRLKLYTPQGVTLWVGKNRNDYNLESTPTDVVLVEVGKWPSTWRTGCSLTLTVRVMVGKMVSLLPYSGVELRDTMQDIANTFVAQVNTDAYILVQQVSPFEFFDAAEGAGVNSQAWLMFEMTMKIWKP